jgi:amylosucrase
MLEELLFLANIGAEGIRLDAVAFIWKEMGTPCENLPQAHTLIKAFDNLTHMAAPGVIFKSEAIVHPDDVVRYFGGEAWAQKEAEIGYNPLLMVELWEAMATGYTHLLTYSMKNRFNMLPGNAAWVNYVRSHDDIGWGFGDEDAAQLSIDGFSHRQYLNRFYTGEEPESYARGLPFQYNPKTQDMRISGTTASLNGLEAALEVGDPQAIEHAIRRILLMYSIVLSMGGVPLLNLGDELGQLNDYTYRDEPTTAHDSRWAHRPHFDWEKAAQRHDPTTLPGRIFLPLKKMIAIRKDKPAFAAGAPIQIIDTHNRALYTYLKGSGAGRTLCVANFRASPQTLTADLIGHHLGSSTTVNLLQAETYGGDVRLSAYGVVWLSSQSSAQ